MTNEAVYPLAPGETGEHIPSGAEPEFCLYCGENANCEVLELPSAFDAREVIDRWLNEEGDGARTELIVALFEAADEGWLYDVLGAKAKELVPEQFGNFVP